MRTLSNLELSYVGGAGTYCGPEGSWLSNLIPDEPLGFKFGDACAIHDDDFRAGSGVSMATANAIFKDNLLIAAGGNPIGIALAYVYYAAVSVFGSLFYEGNQPTQAEQKNIEEFVVNESAEGLVEALGEGVSSDVWYDGSDFGDYVCDSYYECGGGGGGGGGGYNPFESIMLCRDAKAMQN